MTYIQSKDLVDSATLALPESTASIYSAPIDTSMFYSFSFQTVYTYAGLDDNVGVAVLQTSLDGTNWSDYTDSNQDYDDGVGNSVWDVTAKGSRYYRLKLTNSTGTGGTVNVIFHGQYI